MKKVTMILSLLLSTHIFACGYNDNACEQAEQMVKIQKEMLEEQQRANGQASMDAYNQRAGQNHRFDHGNKW